MASALIQCVTRTQAGWITPGPGAACTASAGCSAAWTLIGSFVRLVKLNTFSIAVCRIRASEPGTRESDYALFVLAHAVFLHGVGLAHAVFRHIVGESGRREGERETDRRCGERQDGAGSLHCVVLLKGFGGAFRGHPL